MKTIAVEKASQHLAKAKRSIVSMERAHSFAGFEEAWGEFLAEYSRFLSKLEAGSKANPGSRQWYGGLKRRCKEDQLLQYLYQARNASEHGLGEVSGRTGDSGVIELTEPQNELRVSFMMGPDGRGGLQVINPKVHTGTVKSERWVNPRVVLLPVLDDRSGKTFDPPVMHRGRIYADRSPIGVARLAVAHLAEVLIEASALPE